MLKANDVEQAFIDAAHEQEGGPFNWQRLTHLLNERMADEKDRELGGRQLMFQRPTIGVDGAATRTFR